MKTIYIYTDGACSGNQRDSNIGGWGALLEYGEHQKEIFGGEINTTNNRMEMLALLNALKAIKKPGYNISFFPTALTLSIAFAKNGTKTGRKTVGRIQRRKTLRTGISGKSFFTWFPNIRFPSTGLKVM